MFDPKIYYKTFPSDYHRFKVITSKKILDNLEKYEADILEVKLTDEERTSWKTTLRLEIRQTYFHCIETLFEIINALCPDLATGTFFDFVILERLANAPVNAAYKRANDIAFSDNGLNFLDLLLPPPNNTTSIGHFLFYYGINALSIEKEKTKFTSSLTAIKELLKLISLDFSDREEYNSYKHGLRAIPAINYFEIQSIPELDKFRIDLSNSVSFFSKRTEPEEIKIITQPIDTERDIEMTILCSRLIFNIINGRRACFYKPLEAVDRDVVFHLFDASMIETASSPKVPSGRLEFSMKPTRE